MKPYSLLNSHPVRFSGLVIHLACAWLTTLQFCGSSAQAQVALAYSFETDTGGPDGFLPNGGGEYTQDTIGATEGNNSMKVSLLGMGNTFVGALTVQINPTPTGAVIGDPPGIDHVLFDVTVTEEFIGNFANMGVTVFSAGVPYQFFDEENVDLPIGTHRDLRIDLTSLHGSGESFNETFGEPGSGDLVPSGFQFFFNKPATSDLTLYIDNVRVGMTPAGLPGDYNANGSVDAADYVLWRNGGPLENEVADPDTISPADFDEWRARFGNALPGGAGSQVAVPEPATVWMLVGMGMGLLAIRRGDSARQRSNTMFRHPLGGST
jgi:hypothetical protein